MSTAEPFAKDAVTAHAYLSTGCFHNNHEYCQSNTGRDGNKISAQCKFCAARCVCSCHREESGSGSLVEG